MKANVENNSRARGTELSDHAYISHPVNSNFKHDVLTETACVTVQINL
jgi:hypothetical protein